MKRIFFTACLGILLILLGPRPTGWPQMFGQLRLFVMGAAHVTFEFEDPDTQIVINGENQTWKRTANQMISLVHGRYEFQAFNGGQQIAEESLYLTDRMRWTFKEPAQDAAQMDDSETKPE